MRRDGPGSLVRAGGRDRLRAGRAGSGSPRHLPVLPPPPTLPELGTVARLAARRLRRGHGRAADGPASRMDEAPATAAPRGECGMSWFFGAFALVLTVL